MRVIFEESVVDLHRLIPDVSFDAWCVNLDVLTQPPVGPRRNSETTAATGADAETQHILPGGLPEHQIDFSELSAQVTHAIQHALGYGDIDPAEDEPADCGHANGDPAKADFTDARATDTGASDSGPTNDAVPETHASNPWEEVASVIPRLEWLPTLLLVYQGKEYARFAGLVPKLEIRAKLLDQLPRLAKLAKVEKLGKLGKLSASE
ncbi:hypothetical protein ACRQEF_01115 [Actinotignum sp. GS-2025a]|uniref:hypothetical protein n=1 Tax=Actinotignum TaxID=1653174 RepID=UPI002551432E|nr:hypothetical protein [Actinotignum timonense]MDK6926738.1 hypothetical protein [Actinotignum timonense]